MLEWVESWEKLRALRVVGCVMVGCGATVVRVVGSRVTEFWGRSSGLEDHLAEEVVLVEVGMGVDRLSFRAGSNWLANWEMMRAHDWSSLSRSFGMLAGLG